MWAGKAVCHSMSDCACERKLLPAHVRGPARAHFVYESAAVRVCRPMRVCTEMVLHVQSRRAACLTHVATVDMLDISYPYITESRIVQHGE